MYNFEILSIFSAKLLEKSDLYTPKGKRKRVEENDKENQPPQGVKMARKLLGDKGKSAAIKRLGVGFDFTAAKYIEIADMF